MATPGYTSSRNDFFCLMYVDLALFGNDFGTFCWGKLLVVKLVTPSHAWSHLTASTQLAFYVLDVVSSCSFYLLF